jgi:AmmeMemoRadiSam system protein B
MIVRRMQLPGWYPTDGRRCAAMVEQLLADVRLPADLPRALAGGIVPHAGWVFSGGVAAHTFKALAAAATPATVVVFGAGHSRTHPPRRPALYAEGAWDTPLGTLEVDGRLANRILSVTDLVEEDMAAHDADNTIEVQTPFIKHLWPDAKFVPITMGYFRPANELGRRIATVCRDGGANVLFVGSSDLTHYGADFYGWAPKGVGPAAHEWSKANDRRFIDKVLAMADGELVSESREHQNACGGSAVAAAVAAASEMGATAGRLLLHTTSYEVQPEGRQPANFVGYASVVFGT